MSKKFSFKKQIYNLAENYFLQKAGNKEIFDQYYTRTDGNKVNWNEDAITLRAKDIEDYTRAIAGATDPENPRLGDWMRFRQNMHTDLHLMSCVDNRILPTQCAPIKLVDNRENEDIEAKKLLDRLWYLDCVRFNVAETFEGVKVLEMFDLNEQGELACIKEIPQSNFIPQKGIILLNEYDSEGISYKTGRYRDYYVQIGNDWNLGMFSQIALIFLAKKLGLGSWLGYIEKYGVPPLFAITDRYDDARRKQLFEMLSHFRQNHFAVLQGNEKIEIPSNYNVDAYSTFESLINKIANQEMSKAIQGAVGVSDEKSFVGSAEVAERLLELRRKVDMLKHKFYFNTEIKPRLVKLSPVYARFNDLTLEYDESESLTVKEIIAAVKELAPNFEFNPVELAKLTGLPITGVKSLFGNYLNTPKEEKKNPEGSGKINIYSQLSIEAATWDKAIEKLAGLIYEGKLQPKDLDNNLVLKNYAALNKAASLGFGRDYYEQDIARKMRDNLMKFSGAKSYTLLQELDLLRQESSSKEEFIDNAKKLVHLHNETYLNVEEKFSANSAAAAKDWQKFVKDSDIYPNLKNRTMRDTHVRESHAVNEGIVKPIYEWTSIPPYDPGCRCWLEQTTDPPTYGHDLQGTDPRYAHNPGMTGDIFTDKHTYFGNIRTADKTDVNNYVNLLKQYAPYNRIINLESGRVLISDFADQADISLNLDAAKKTATFLGKDIYIRPHSETTTGYKNPEFGIGKQKAYGDLKTFQATTSIDKFITNSVKSANKQGCSYIVMDFTNAEGDFIDSLARSLRGVLNDKKELNRNIKNVIVIQSSSIGLIKRSDINGKNYMDKFKKLFKSK